MTEQSSSGEVSTFRPSQERWAIIFRRVALSFILVTAVMGGGIIYILSQPACRETGGCGWQVFFGAMILAAPIIFFLAWMWGRWQEQQKTFLTMRLESDVWIIPAGYHSMVTVPQRIAESNANAERAGVSRETFFRALAAEGVEVSGYVPSPIPSWERLKTRGYRGPRTIWTKNLARAGVKYRSLSLPGCEEKVARSMDMDWNYIRRRPGRMAKLAGVFLKVEEHLEELHDWERRQGSRGSKGRRAKVRPTRREVLD